MRIPRRGGAEEAYDDFVVAKGPRGGGARVAAGPSSALSRKMTRSRRFGNRFVDWQRAAAVLERVGAFVVNPPPP